MTVYIYALCDPRDGEIRYVGKTIYLSGRLSVHMKASTRTKKDCWIKTLKSIGLKPSMETLEEIYNSNDLDWQDAERFWITYLGFIGCKLTNSDSGGRNGKCASLETRKKLSDIVKTRMQNPEQRKKHSEGCKGIKKSREHIAKIAAAHRGMKRPEDFCRRMSEFRTGKKSQHPKSDRTRQLLSIALKGQKRTPEQIRVNSECHKGIIPSAETRLKMSLSHLGKTLTPESRAKITGRPKKSAIAFIKEHLCL